MKRDTFVRDIKIRRDGLIEYVRFKAGQYWSAPKTCRAAIDKQDGYLNWECQHNHTQNFNPDHMEKFFE